MKTYTFTPDASCVDQIKGTATIAELEQEVSVYSATPNFVRRHCGPIANAILDRVPDGFFQRLTDQKLFPSINVRVHRLFPGDYPAYPGWHCDGGYREDYFAQPDLSVMADAYNIICSVSTHADGVSNTEILTDPLTLQLESSPSPELPLWTSVHRAVEANPQRSIYVVPDGQLVQFSNATIHRCQPAKIRGWRLFFRFSMWHRPGLGDGGMISKQEIIYRLTEGDGW